MMTTKRDWQPAVVPQPSRKELIPAPVPLRVLILEDHGADARLLLHQLRQGGYEPHWERVDTESDYLARLDPGLDVILADYSLPQFDALRALRLLRERELDVPFVIVSGSIGEDTAVAAMKEGATDYFLKDRLGRLVEAVKHALEERRLRGEKRQADEVLRQRVRVAAVSADVGIALTRSDSLCEMLRACADSVVSNLDVAHCRVWTVNPRENVLELWTGDDVDGPGAPGRVPIGQFRIGQVAQERRPYATNDLPHDPQLINPAWVAEEGLVAFAGYPLIVADRLVGVLGVYARRPMTEVTLEALGSVASAIALGIEHKGAEEALREREAQVRLLLDSTAEAIYGLDAQGNCTLCNSACLRLLGYKEPADLLGKNMHALMHHSRRDGSPYPVEQCRIYQAFQEGEATHVDDEVVWRADGSSFPAEYWSHPIRRGGQVVGAVVTFLDITERRQAEERLRHVLTSSPAIIYSLTLRGEEIRQAWVSDNLRTLMGYDRDEALAPGWWEAGLHPADRAAEVARWPTFLQDGRLVSEYRFRHKDGTYRWVRDEKHLLRDAAGQPAEAVGSWSDVTERKQLEEQFRHSQKMEAIGRLAGGVAHDFNNLLTIITGYSEMGLAALRPGDPLREVVAQVLKASQRAASLTRQLLAFGRRQVLQPVTLDLNALLSDMEKMLRRLIGEDIELHVCPGAGLWRVKADPGMMEQVVMNLVVNARDAMPSGGKLTIETHNVNLGAAYAETHAEVVPGDDVLLAVTDTGHGMDAAVKAQIFEPFFTTKEAGKGTGLGLATVHGIVKQSGGRIEVYSEPSHGTTFKIYLPRDAGSAPARKSYPGVAQWRRGTETVLLVEDEEGVRALARTVLEMNGYSVLEASAGDQALLLVQQHAGPIHLLMTDVVMPRMSGPQLAERLARLRPTARVLYLSGYTDDAVVHHGILGPDTPFLQKPFGPEALARKVREVLDATPEDARTGVSGLVPHPPREPH